MYETYGFDYEMNELIRAKDFSEYDESAWDYFDDDEYYETDLEQDEFEDSSEDDVEDDSSSSSEELFVVLSISLLT